MTDDMAREIAHGLLGLGGTALAGLGWAGAFILKTWAGTQKRFAASLERIDRSMVRIDEHHAARADAILREVRLRRPCPYAGDDDDDDDSAPHTAAALNGCGGTT